MVLVQQLRGGGRTCSSPGVPGTPPGRASREPVIQAPATCSTHDLRKSGAPGHHQGAADSGNGQKRPSTALGVAAGMIPPPRRGRCAGRGQPQQSLPACRYSGHGSPLPRMVALRAHLLDSCPPVRGSHHGAPLGDEATAQQSGSPRTWLHRVPAHFAQQATAATLGDRGAPGCRGRRSRSGSRSRRPRCGPRRRAPAMRRPAGGGAAGRHLRGRPHGDRAAAPRRGVAASSFTWRWPVRTPP